MGEGSVALDLLGANVDGFQFIRELTHNSIQAIQALPEGQRIGEIVWDADPMYLQKGILKLSCADNGVGMSPVQMSENLNWMFASTHHQDKQGNFGIGAKVSALPRNPHGVVYDSWQNGHGTRLHLWKDEEGKYGAREHADGRSTGNVNPERRAAIKTPLIEQHGTIVTLLGMNEQENTHLAPKTGATGGDSWLVRYLNTRYYQIPEGVTIRARREWDGLLKGSSTGKTQRANIIGQAQTLNDNCERKGSLRLEGAEALWWLLPSAKKSSIGKSSGTHGTLGHIAALHGIELYDRSAGRTISTRFGMFGVSVGHTRVVIYVRPDAEGPRAAHPDISRVHLQIGEADPLPWEDWGEQFRSQMPEELRAYVEEMSMSSARGSHREAIQARLSKVQDALRLQRYRPSMKGDTMMPYTPGDQEGEVEAGGTGSPPPEDGDGGGADPPGSGPEEGGGKVKGEGVNPRAAGELEKQAKDRKAKATEGISLPSTHWISLKEGTRGEQELEDRAACYDPRLDKLIINADFRGFTRLIELAAKKYPSHPAAHGIAEKVIREGMEQTLIEVVVGARSLRGSSTWDDSELDACWSEEALTAATLVRERLITALDDELRRSCR